MDIQKSILIVDDTELNINTLMDLLDEKYDILAALDGESALEIVEEEENIDLILLDIMMPGLDGFEVCRRLKANSNTQDIPIIFITAKTDDESIEKAYELGGVDYITKPFRAREVLSRIINHLTLSEQSHILEQKVQDKTQELHDINQELEETQREVIFTMGSIGERRSKETGYHVTRVALYSELLAKHYGLEDKEVQMLKEASPMHDIGKVAIPDEILNKPARFTPEEFEHMKEHAIHGYEMLKYSNRPLLKTAAIVASEHHEKWDGTGYPNGLKGEQIHIYGRITALADVFDALGSYRVYKDAWSDDEIFKLFKDEKGKHFDPQLIDIFFDNLDQFLSIRDKFADL
ncbi:MAG: two-component system response regulator [Campylobacterota bacterium]|nr:two-component system response regulator [Campylobacterota bacterium]